MNEKMYVTIQRTTATSIRPLSYSLTLLCQGPNERICSTLNSYRYIQYPAPAEANLGFSVGEAKDADNFFQNLEKGDQKLFSIFSSHFGQEVAVLNDPTLQKELDVLNSLKGKDSGKRVDDWKVQK